MNKLLHAFLNFVNCLLFLFDINFYQIIFTFMFYVFDTSSIKLYVKNVPRFSENYYKKILFIYYY